MIHTRFAPSPTGMLHIGSVRTALFNILFAKAHGGQCSLRIEDTDTARNTPEAVRAIHDSLAWAGLVFDGVPVLQSERRARHVGAAEQLLQTGHAYRCAMTPDEVDAQRQAAIARKVPFLLNSPWRDRNPVEIPAGLPTVVRFRAPRQGSIEFLDLVQGAMSRKNAHLDDLVLLRADGTPTYMLAVVVDDHDMGITHVLRGDDHLTNTYRQIALFEAFGWTVPQFGHIPLILDASGQKMSKRRGAAGAAEFAAMGMLPEALLNALVRLGWDGPIPDVASLDAMAKVFTADGFNRAAARFDPKKLLSLNAAWMRQMDQNTLFERFLEFSGLDPAHPLIGRVRQIFPSVVERSRTLVEMRDQIAFVLAPIAPDDRAKAVLNDVGRAHVTEAIRALACVTRWEAPHLHDALVLLAKDRPMAEIAQPIRAALSGRTQAPPVDQMLAALGQEEALNRLRAATSESV